MMYAVADAAINSAASVTTSDGSKISPEDLAKLAPSAVKDLFGGTAQVTFMPQSEKVKITMKVDPGSGTASKLKIAKGDTVSVEIPYSYVQANRASLADIAKYIDKNSVNPTSMGTLNAFSTNQNATVSAPSFMQSAGFNYSVSGVEDESGRFGLGMTFSMYDPNTKENYTKYVFQQIGNPTDPTSYEAPQRVISDMYQNYISQRIKIEDAADKTIVPYK
jgi:hypothetical protein